MGKKNDGSFDDNEANNAPASTFQSQAAEGEIMAKQGDFKKAIDAYTRALSYRPNEKHCLVARAKCHLALGDHESSLEDAEAALKEDNEFFKAKFIKAEALYAKGDFEAALVNYHRGFQLKPEFDEFRLGIQKAREAIENSIGKRILPSDYQRQKSIVALNESTKQKSKSDELPSSNEIEKEATVQIADERSAKQLLGELYVDREYLTSFLNDPDFKSNPNAEIRDTILDGLRYLDSRIEFWRQQKPLYARRKDSLKQNGSRRISMATNGTDTRRTSMTKQ